MFQSYFNLTTWVKHLLLQIFFSWNVEIVSLGWEKWAHRHWYIFYYIVYLIGGRLPNNTNSFCQKYKLIKQLKSKNFISLVSKIALKNEKYALFSVCQREIVKKSSNLIKFVIVEISRRCIFWAIWTLVYWSDKSKTLIILILICGRFSWKLNIEGRKFPNIFLFTSNKWSYL